ncbi:Ribonuclease Y [uncultured archaeon]|nr:Ribonuclease Y [uncultured archaeon]
MPGSIVANVRGYVESECRKPSSKYGYEPFHDHFVPVHRYAKALAGKLGADVEIVELAAWLHDIGSIIHGREDHHLSGARIAGEKLKELGYPPDRIERVKHCIMSHRGSQKVERESPEARIIAEADAMSHFDDITGILQAAFVFEKKNRAEARESTRKKLQRSWEKLSPSAKEIVRPRYDAAMLLLSRE